jgi:hypothetical protein
LYVIGYRRLRGATSCRFACVLAGVVGDEIRAAARPATTELVFDAKSVDQVIGAFKGTPGTRTVMR